MDLPMAMRARATPQRGARLERFLLCAGHGLTTSTRCPERTTNDFSFPARVQRLGGRRDHGGLRAALHAQELLALEAIGGAVALNYGFSNALCAILTVGLLIFLTGLPIAYYAARYGLDMDLLSRGAGFGYLGSTITSLIYAVFTFIFFALEAAIMALALQMVVDWPL